MILQGLFEFFNCRFVLPGLPVDACKHHTIPLVIRLQIYRLLAIVGSICKVTDLPVGVGHGIVEPCIFRKFYIGFRKKIQRPLIIGIFKFLQPFDVG